MPGCQRTTAWPSMSSPRRPARPVSWVYSPGVMSAWVSPFHFVSFSSTTVRAGMLIPSARVSVANTTLTRPAQVERLDALLERRQHPGVVGGDAAAQCVEEVVVAEHLEIGSGKCAHGPLDVREDLVALCRGVEPEVGVEALLDGGVTAGTAEDEDDRGEQQLALEPFDHVDAAGDPDPAAVADAPGVLRRPRLALAGRSPVAHQPGAGPVVPRDPHQLVVDRCSSRTNPADASTSEDANRSSSRRPTMTCW